ncbi:MAG: hypothetical protein NTV31_11620 [Bacteroidia bacterium]|nr:hypothetical protein [Bacteroidia bacterium]
MIAPDVTVVKASSVFWEDLLSKHLQIENYYEVIEINDDQIIIKSDDSKDVLEAIIKLSKEYPNQMFHVKTGSKDSWQNFVQLYECQNGTSILVNEGYEFVFCTTSKDGKKYDTKELIEYKRKLVEFYRKIDQPNPTKIHMSLGFYKCQDEEDLNMDGLDYNVSYTTKNSVFSAKRNGLTYIIIEVEAYTPIF